MTDHDLLLQIVHKLDHMATKEDIVNFATKDDLRASIDEVKAEFNDKLSNFATKDDLKEAIEDAKSELYEAGSTDRLILPVCSRQRIPPVKEGTGRHATKKRPDISITASATFHF